MIYLSYCEKNNLTKPQYGRKLHNTAYELLKKLLSQKGIYDYEIKTNAYGKPYIKGNNIYFNISHCDGACICVLDKYDVGVDIENIRPRAKNNIMRRCFTENEIKTFDETDNKDELFFKYWTLKESYIKAVGMGLSYPMKDIEFNLKENITASDNSFKFFQKKYDNFIISLATKRNIEDIRIKVINL